MTCQIESCLNSRPLITSHTIDGISALTPGHFLIGRPLKAYPESTIIQEPSLLRRWTMCQAMVHHFWRRWSHEYLQQLQALPKWRNATPNRHIGDVVIIKDDNAFTCHWLLARVVGTFPGRDGLVRVATLKTATTTLKRPIAKLALIYREEKDSNRTLPVSSSRGRMFGQKHPLIEIFHYQPSMNKKSCPSFFSAAA